MLKKKLIDFLRKRGFFNAVAPFFIFIKRPSLLFRDILYRVNGAPDGFPLPPPKLIFLAVGNGSATDYYEGGKDITSITFSYLKDCSINIQNFIRILDFGCGSGRLIRHLFFLKDTEIYGTDYNKELINWCEKNLPFAKFQTNNLEPPLDFKNDMFDFVYLYSVFTHLSEELQKEWMEEFQRILTPGGILLFTTMGDQFLGDLSKKEKKQYETGQIVIKNIGFEGSNEFGSYQSFQFAQNHMLEGYELVSCVPGNTDFRQDIYIIRKKQSLSI